MLNSIKLVSKHLIRFYIFIYLLIVPKCNYFIYISADTLYFIIPTLHDASDQRSQKIDWYNISNKSA